MECAGLSHNGLPRPILLHSEFPLNRECHICLHPWQLLDCPPSRQACTHLCWLASGKAATASSDGRVALQPLAYMGLHISLTAATFAVCKIWWMSSRAHTAFLLCVLCVSAWNGEPCSMGILDGVLFMNRLPGE